MNGAMNEFLNNPLPSQTYYVDKHSKFVTDAAGRTIVSECHSSELSKHVSRNELPSQNKTMLVRSKGGIQGVHDSGHIQQHYTEELTLNRVSEIVHVSPPYISKLFKEKLGMTFLEYLTRIRMEKAKQMLRETQESIRRIGCEVGYQDPNYFSRAFKKYVGVTPREYRDNGSNIE